MIVIESRASRRIVGRLDRGASLTDALLGICRERRVRSGEIRAIGSLESVEVAEYDQASRAWKPGRPFSGGLEIVSLSGNVSERGGQLSVHLHAALMRDRDNGVEMLGGHVVSGRVFALEFTIEVWDDVILRRAEDPATGLVLWNQAIEIPASAAADLPPPAPQPPQPPPSPPPPAPLPSYSGPSWADVAQVSARKPPAEPEPEETDESLEPGDVLIHPTFGRCEVQRIEGSYEFAHVRLKNGRLVRLSLDILKVVAAGKEDGKRVFRARID
jgi:uncharacterized protein